jgi:hypothetical protein
MQDRDARLRMSTLDDIRAVARLLEPFPHPWFVSGGWAIDLFLGEVTRDHGDREVGIFRRDQAALRQHLADWEWFKAVSAPDGGVWTPWEGEWLPLSMHQLLTRPAGSSPDPPQLGRPEEIEFFVNDAVDGMWECKRNPAITRPAEAISLRSPSGIPVLAPEIQLLYKAKWHRPKDEHDFSHALARMGLTQRTWLKESLQVVHPDDPWLARL